MVVGARQQGGQAWAGWGAPSRVLQAGRVGRPRGFGSALPHSLIQLLVACLLSAYYVPGTVLGLGCRLPVGTDQQIIR